MHPLLPALLLTTLLAGCTASSLPGSGSRELHGHLSLGPQFSALRPCGSEHSWQLVVPASLGEQLEARYLQQAGVPYEEAYLHARVRPQTQMADCRDCQEHAGILQLDELIELRAAASSDCR
ncbi:hypothetical protein [Pseudomonas sp. NW5]|uniref:hypothetical protein n=1 Tax=Pseudomonas sp. NW5 TaxID=2934934 RepID=UPI002020012B|nr:hypothetical protein [Pseudomonas sp. NW5]MCL7462307.1 hypothetical protein [Pseudomonas sp. NW5]